MHFFNTFWHYYLPQVAGLVVSDKDVAIASKVDYRTNFNHTQRKFDEGVEVSVFENGDDVASYAK